MRGGKNSDAHGVKWQMICCIRENSGGSPRFGAIILRFRFGSARLVQLCQKVQMQTRRCAMPARASLIYVSPVPPSFNAMQAVR
jgi:hypothetical protein